MIQPALFYAAICGLMLMGLTIYVVQGRVSMRIGVGDGNNALMLRRIRIHANFVEHVPMALLLIYFVQQAGYSFWIVHTLGALLVLARIFHIWALSKTGGPSPQRVVGVVGTLAVLFFAALFSALGAFGVHF
jgi:uncharacterized protein